MESLVEKRSELYKRDTNLLNKEAWASVKKNAKIKEALDKALSVYNDLEEWDYKQWAKYYDQGHQVVTFDSYAKKLIDKQIKLQKTGTGIYYRDVLHALQKFINKTEIHFNEINKQLLKEFEEDILARGFKGERTMRGLKALYSKAVEDEVVPMKLMPFKTAYNPVGYKFSHLKKIKNKNKGRIDHLSNEQIDAIKNYEPKNKAYQKAKDIWLFSYYTMGVNLKDISLLQPSDIKAGVWYFDKQKTSTGYESTPLRKECLDIIDRWYDPSEKYIFHDILNDKYDSSDEEIKKRIVV